MYYGKVGLTNYTKCGYRKLTEADFLDYFYYPVFVKDVDTIVESSKKSIFSVYSSIWRMIAGPIQNIKIPDITHFDFAKRRVEAVYLDDLLPNVLTDKLWKENTDQIFKALSKELNQIGSVCRHSSVKLVVILPPNIKLDMYILRVFNRLWQYLGYPKQNANTVISHRFFVYSSSLLGSTIEEKQKHIQKIKNFSDKFCIIADDLSFYKLIKLCKEENIRPSFDVAESKNKDNKRIVITSKEWKAFENLWRVDKSSSIMLPTVFSSDPIDNKEFDKTSKILKHYIRRANVVFK